MPGVIGKTNNPNGRPPAGNAFVEQLREALKKAEKERGISLLEHAVNIAYESKKDHTVLITLLKKLLPDQVEHSGKDGEPIKIQWEQ